jgi:hypothetical protein
VNQSKFSPDERDDSVARSGAISSGIALKQHPIRRNRQRQSSSGQSCSYSVNQSNFRPDERDDSAVRSDAISSGIAPEQHPIRRDRQRQSSSGQSCSNSMNQSNFRHDERDDSAGRSGAISSGIALWRWQPEARPGAGAEEPRRMAPRQRSATAPRCRGTHALIPPGQPGRSRQLQLGAERRGGD